MSTATVNAAIDRIRSEPEFHAGGRRGRTPALASFELSDDEQAAIVDALRDDLGAAGDDVEGFDKSSGKVHFNDFSITRKIDAASPMLFALYTPDPPGHGPGVEGAEDGGLL